MPPLPKLRHVVMILVSAIATQTTNAVKVLEADIAVLGISKATSWKDPMHTSTMQTPEIRQADEGKEFAIFKIRVKSKVNQVSLSKINAVAKNGDRHSCVQLQIGFYSDLSSSGRVSQIDVSDEIACQVPLGSTISSLSVEGVDIPPSRTKK